MKSLTKLLVAVLLMGVLVGNAKTMNISGTYFPFPREAWTNGKPADNAFLLVNLGRLLSDDETPRATTNGRLVAVRLDQSGKSITIRMYDETGQELLNHTKPFDVEWHNGKGVITMSTAGRLGDSTEGGKRSSVVEVIRMFRDDDRLYVNCESTQTFSRWLWIKEKKYTHKTSYVFVISNEPGMIRSDR